MKKKVARDKKSKTASPTWREAGRSRAAGGERVLARVVPGQALDARGGPMVRGAVPVVARMPVRRPRAAAG